MILDTQLRRGHLALWRAWRMDSNGALSHEDACHAIMAAGFDCMETSEILRMLEGEGSVNVHWNRDFAWYNVLKDEMGFAAHKAQAHLEQ